MKEVNPQGLNEKDEEVSKLMVDIWVKFASSEWVFGLFDIQNKKFEMVDGVKKRIKFCAGFVFG